jgi:hypothetical protein
LKTSDCPFGAGLSLAFLSTVTTITGVCGIIMGHAGPQPGPPLPPGIEPGIGCTFEGKVVTLVASSVVTLPGIADKT